MKNLRLLSGLALGLMLAGCPGDDTSDDGNDDNNDSTTTMSLMTTDNDTTDATPPATDDTTTVTPPATDDTTTTTTDPTDTDDTTTTTDTTGEPALSFEMDVWPILEPSCLGAPGSCHDPGAGGLAMLDAGDAYANIFDVPSNQSGLDRIEPGSPDDSYFWAKLIGTHTDVGGSGSPMPLGGGPLAQPDLDIIEQWIVDGAEP